MKKHRIEEGHQRHGAPPADGPEQHGAAAGLSGQSGNAVPAAPAFLNAPAGAGQQEGAGLDPKALLDAFRRRWFLATSLGLLFGGVAAAVAWSLVPAPYTATSELRIKSVPERILFNTAEPQARFKTYKQTQKRLIKQRDVLNSVLQQPDIARLSLVQQQQRPIEWLEKELSVGSPAAEFIRISLSGQKPAELRAIVEAVTTTYLEDVVGEQVTDRRRRLTKLEEIYDKEQTSLRKKRESLKQYAENWEAINEQTLTAAQQSDIELYSQLRQEYNRVRFELKRTRMRLEWLKEGTEPEIDLSDKEIETLIAENPRYQEAKQLIRRQEDFLRELKDYRTKGHRRVKEAEEKLAELKNDLDIVKNDLKPQVIEEFRNNLKADEEASLSKLQHKITQLEAFRDDLKAELANQERQGRENARVSYEVETLRKEIARREAIVDRIGQEITKLKIELESPPRIVLAQEPTLPHVRDTGRKYKMTGMAGLGFFGLIAGGIVLLEYRSRRIGAFHDVSQQLGMRVMGSVPTVPRSVTNGRRGRHNGHAAYWQNLLTESIASARTMLLRKAEHDSVKTVMVASAMSGEGKTTLASHLAMSLARTNRRVLLLDCDMRRPTVHGVFGQAIAPGFCELLRGETGIDECLQTTSLEALTVLPAGELSNEALHKLAQDRLGEIFAELEERFDFIIADSSPLLPVTDPLLVAQHTDAVLFAIRRDVSRFTKVETAYQRLKMLGVPCLGAVVIGMDDNVYRTAYPRFRLTSVNGDSAEYAANGRSG